MPLQPSLTSVSLASMTPARPRASGRNSLLEALPARDLALLSPHLRETTLPSGKVLHEAGDPIETVYFPHTGMISLFAPSREPDLVKLTTIGREAGIGLRVGLGSPLALCKAVVQVPVSAARIDSAHFVDVVQQSATLRRAIVAAQDVMALKIQQAVVCNALHDVEGRLSRLLLEARDKLGSDVLPLTQETLAMMLGVRRTTVTIVARMLQSAGFIHYRRGVIRIRDVAGLEHAACECYHTLGRLTHAVHTACAAD